MSKGLDDLTHEQLVELVLTLRNRLMELEGKVFRLERKVSPTRWTKAPADEPQQEALL